MSDNKKWFKVWTTILLDPEFSNLAIADVGRWCKLGALMVSQGENGMLALRPPAQALVLALECSSFDGMIELFKRLPNVRVEMCESDNGKTFVIMRNWFKYQVDSTAYERVKRSRYKRRGEEKRGEVDVKVNFSTSPSPRSAPPAPPLAPAGVTPRSGYTPPVAEPEELMTAEDWRKMRENLKSRTMG